MPSQVPQGGNRGWIIPIGGAEEKENDRAILSRFVDLCGGRDADIVVIPTASKLADTGARYEAIFRDLGVARVVALDFDTRRDAEERGRIVRIEHASGVFITGGNQLRLATLLGGTSVARALRQSNAHGTHIAGTSAGAAFLSEHMIAFGEEGATPIAGSVRLAPGLGLTNRFIIDAKPRGSAVSGQHHPVGNVLADETGAALAFVQLAIARAKVALDALRLAFLVGQGVPPARRVIGFRGFQVSFHFCTP